jgi:hypothetical protein
MAVEERQHEKRDAILVEIAGAAALADRGFPEKPAITPLTTKETKEHFSEVPNPRFLRMRDPYGFRKKYRAGST